MLVRKMIFAVGACVVFGCSNGSSPPVPKPEPSGATAEASTPADAPMTVRVLEDGLTDEERSRFNHLSMGSELIPLRWLQVLHNHETGAPFLEGVGRFGLIADPADPDGLPIGLTTAESPDLKGVGPVIGLNCAACHTGVIRYGEHTIVTTGGQSVFDVVTFNEQLFASMGATVRDPRQLVEFVVRLWRSEGYMSGEERDLERHMTALLTHLDAASGVAADRIRQRVKQLVDDAQSRLARANEDADQPAAAESKYGRLLSGFDSAKHRILASAEQALLPLQRLSDVHGREAVTRFSQDLYVTVHLLEGRGSMLRQLVELKHRDLPQTASGPGRVDDFNVGRNLLFPPKFAAGMTAPCSIPPLWGLHDVSWTDWDGNTTSALGRSMLTALAGGASFDPKTFLSSVPVQNILELEQLSERLQAPRWPEDVLGRLDEERVSRGHAIFRDQCARCHRPADAPNGETPKNGVVRLEEINTDPERLRSFAVPVGDEPLAAGLQRVSGLYLDKARRTGQVDRDAFDAMNRDHPNQWRRTEGYVARNLEGIFATAPYLHNGSVPTLWHLLQDPERRPARFSVGHANYDADKVGYRIDEDGPFQFDTTQTGNSNAGHRYGTDLPKEQKQDLLEYLKNL